MISILIGLSFTFSSNEHVPSFTVQFNHGEIGQNVTVCIDNDLVETSFAGKLRFFDGKRSWMSLCADVRSPIRNGQTFSITLRRTDSLGLGYKMAGSIVYHCFEAARTEAQCAGLQLAVWEAIEDGGDQPDFTSGHFRVRADATVLAYATAYYGAAFSGGSAFLLQTSGAQGGASQGDGSPGGGDGQSQITP